MPEETRRDYCLFFTELKQLTEASQFETISINLQDEKLQEPTYHRN